MLLSLSRALVFWFSGIIFQIFLVMALVVQERHLVKQTMVYVELVLLIIQILLVR
jgi:hypothetical protein